MSKLALSMAKSAFRNLGRTLMPYFRASHLPWYLSNPGVDNQQIQRVIGASLRYLDGLRFLRTAQGSVIRRRSVKVCQLRKANHHPGRLPQRQVKQDPCCWAELDCSIREHCRATLLGAMSVNQISS
jgi:hypothetical protein